MPPSPPSPPPRRPGELSLQELVHEAERLLDAVDQAERRNAARARELEALKAQADLIGDAQSTLRRSLEGKPIDLDDLERRVDALAGILGRLGDGMATDGLGSISARIAARAAPHGSTEEGGPSA